METLINLRVLCACVFAVAVTNDAQIVARQPADAHLPANERRAILGATLGGERQFIVATLEKHQKNWLVRFLRCSLTGAIDQTWSLPIDASVSLRSSVRAFGRGEHLIVGWLETNSRLWLARMTEGKVEKRLLLEDPSGGIMDLWILGDGNNRRLFIKKYRFAQPEKELNAQSPAFPRERDWIYSYELRGDSPKFERKTCIERDRAPPFLSYSSRRVECASNGTEVLIWQVVSDIVPQVTVSALEVETLRVAKWQIAQELTWIPLYTGNDVLGLIVDPTAGSKALVREWKSPQDASGVVCAVQPLSTKIVPICSYGPRARQFRFIRLHKARCWALVRRESERFEVTFLDDQLQSRAVRRFSPGGVVDCALVSNGMECYLIIMRTNSFSVKKIPLERAMLSIQPSNDE